MEEFIREIQKKATKAHKDLRTGTAVTLQTQNTATKTPKHTAVKSKRIS